ncbi:hypothetical protein EDC01DRAFT_91924 [Geopyxis carbonaria]|nr:hypothetical protein EDC01DRAFT_91924 [Geopyxis carbonaria]
MMNRSGKLQNDPTSSINLTKALQRPPNSTTQFSNPVPFRNPGTIIGPHRPFHRPRILDFEEITAATLPPSVARLVPAAHIRGNGEESGIWHNLPVTWTNVEGTGSIYMHLIKMVYARYLDMHGPHCKALLHHFFVTPRELARAARRIVDWRNAWQREIMMNLRAYVLELGQAHPILLDPARTFEDAVPVLIAEFRDPGFIPGNIWSPYRDIVDLRKMCRDQTGIGHLYMSWFINMMWLTLESLKDKIKAGTAYEDSLKMGADVYACFRHIGKTDGLWAHVNWYDLPEKGGKCEAYLREAARKAGGGF